MADLQTVSTTPATDETTVLSPSFKLPLGLGAIALPVLLWQPWGGAPVLLLAAFLAIQTARIRLAFTPQTLDVRLGERLLRQFPYAEWLNWVIFWHPVPILFYFREVNSIHFLPVLFNANELTTQLEQHIPLATLQTSPKPEP
ncbi:MAG: DUF3119 family protein [Cyanobacteria bacterium J06632_22]